MLLFVPLSKLLPPLCHPSLEMNPVMVQVAVRLPSCPCTFLWRVSRWNPEPRKPSHYISRWNKPAGAEPCPPGLRVALHPPHSSRFHSFLPACISLLQLRVTTEWAGVVAERLGQGGRGEWATWTAPGTQRRTVLAGGQDVSQSPSQPKDSTPLSRTAKGNRQN